MSGSALVTDGLKKACTGGRLLFDFGRQRLQLRPLHEEGPKLQKTWVGGGIFEGMLLYGVLEADWRCQAAGYFLLACCCGKGWDFKTGMKKPSGKTAEEPVKT